ncbi:hypothetical protein Goari_013124 [Gossypium aridum]|uniref:(-)-isopiperitenol/(-)-carveol dehydrogenase, mitochondrial-like n=1 Tax=Gossypium aridum TaxID=34290 RepID=A0A7J8XDS0_GOSAI|nr:hypothetical protein [Gossypium aridum]
MSNKLQGKIAIITGGASGIGEAAAHHFAAHGAQMIVIADIQDELGQKVVESIGSHKCSFMHCDVTDEEQVKNLVQSTVQNYRRLDIMFSNAGIFSSSTQTVLELDLAQFDRLFNINVRGMAACVKHAARAMVELNVRGSIVCTASVASSAAGEMDTDYFITKHAVLGLMRSASKQLGVHGIRVNSVSPFAVGTPLLCRYLGKEVEEVEQTYEPYTRLKGAVLKTKHVADAVLFLASQDSELITGHDLVVDAGYHLVY